VALKHAKTSAKADGGDSTLVLPSDWNAGHLVDVDGVPMASRTNNTDPTAPAADNLVIYAKTIAGRVMPKWIGPAGVDMLVQPHVGTNNVRLVTPGSGGTVGISPSNVATPAIDSNGMTCSSGLVSTGGTFAQVAIASTNLLTQTKRVSMTTGATSGAGTYIKGDATECWRGNAAGLGGFFYACRFALPTAVASSTRVFVGLRDVVTAPTNVDYTAAGTTTPGRIGMAITGNTGNWQLNRALTGSAPTNIDLGASFAYNAAHLLELVLYAKPNDSTVYYRVTNLSTAAVTNGSFTTNIPATTTFLSTLVHINNNTAASSVLNFVKQYLETDF